MEYSSVQTAYNRLEEADKAFSETIRAFITETAFALCERMERSARADPVLFSKFRIREEACEIRRIDGEDHPFGGDERVFEVKFSLPTLLRQAFDGKASNGGLWHALLSENGWFGTLDDLLMDGDACAFSLGLDDRRIRFRDRERNEADSEKRCPGHGGAYEKGRSVSDSELSERGVRLSPGTPLCPVLTVSAYAGDDGISVEAMIGEGQTGMLKMNRSILRELDPSDTPEDAAARICGDLLANSQAFRQRKNPAPRM